MHVNYVYFLAAFAALRVLAVPTVVSDEQAWTLDLDPADIDAVTHEAVDHLSSGGLEFATAKIGSRAVPPPAPPTDPKESKPKGVPVPPSGPSGGGPGPSQKIMCRQESYCRSKIQASFNEQKASTRRRLHPFCPEGPKKKECVACVNRESLVLATAETVCFVTAGATFIGTAAVGTPVIIVTMTACMAAAGGVYAGTIKDCDKS
ncbi:hypothetical protein CSAL01_13602 [Colletotrichum salicis]|uniref:Uncharacterized protein n=1 Tax=Colletotrichum salicis TaxID=1209931 RepID=A0A135V9Z7_9PEZI|nr:hypothetical protein CSAL01_13602 [Colletotrichum salicis]